MIIGFDLDGTLASEEFDKIIWHEKIPKFYAKKNSIELEDAKEKVFSVYYKEKFIENNPEWTNIEYWFKRFELGKRWDELMEDMKKHVFLFDEVKEILTRLKTKHKLIIISNAHPHFLKIKLESEGLLQYFDEVFSTTEFPEKMKSPELYKKVCKELGIKTKDFVYVGNDYQEDYENAKIAGVKSFFLDRSKKDENQDSVHNLLEFEKKLEKL